MPAVRPLYLPPIFQEGPDAGRIILRDGTTATIRRAAPDDIVPLRLFFAGLSLESRIQRFFSPSPPSDALLAEMCDSSDPSRQLTLVAVRVFDDEPTIIASANYNSPDGKSAEVAFAVDDKFQGKGLASIMLERLAVIAAQHGITSFWAVTHADNRAMIETFRHSGFETKSRWDGSDIEIHFPVLPNPKSVERSEMRDRVATIASLRPFFQPKAIAVVGASRDQKSIGYALVDALVMNNYQGTIYPVNPNTTVVHSIRTYPSLAALPETPDLAVIAVPKEGVLDTVDACADRGVRAIVVAAAGYAESGPAGAALQQELVDRVRGHGMRLIGPGSLGIINTDPAVSMNASFSTAIAPAGRLALVSQSGSVGVGILALAQQRGLGISAFVSLGNKADVSSNDLLQYWEEDATTTALLMYLESFGNPRRFARLARRVSRVKPIVVIKSGRGAPLTPAVPTNGKAKATRQAPGSAVRSVDNLSDPAVDALFQQAGVVRADTLEEMFDLAAALSSQPLPRGRRVVIVTNASGAGRLCEDACRAGGLDTVRVVDVTAWGGPEEYRTAVAGVLSDDSVDAVIAVYIAVGVADDAQVRRAIADAAAEAGATKPVLVCQMGALTTPADGASPLPIYVSPETPGRVLSKMARYAEWRAAPSGVIPDYPDVQPAEARERIRTAAKRNGAKPLSERVTREVLAAFGLPLGGRAKREADAVKPDGAEGMVHRPGTDVALRIRVIHDRSFGPVLGLAVAGTPAEQLGHEWVALTPLTDADAAHMVRSFPGGQWLVDLDVAALEETLLRVSRLVEELPEVVELELKPVVVQPHGVVIQDARMMVAPA